MQYEANSLTQDDIDRFTTAIGEIKDFYVQPTDDKKILENGIRGMFNGLDPHSEYLDASAYKALKTMTQGSFGGIGIEVTGEYGVLKVISPLDNTPAFNAGIKPNDYIVAINGKLVDQMSMNEAIDQLQGPPNSQVTLTIIRQNIKKPLAFHLVRQLIHVTSVSSKLLGNNIGYIRISEFQAPTADLMIKAINALNTEAKHPLNGLILDLRNNPGGLLNSAVDVSNAFLNKKSTLSYNHLIVYTKGRFPDAQFSAKVTNLNDILNSAPLLVLINTGSASASEIVAGALQDYHRAIIAGTTSFGKGSVQTILPLDKEHAVKLTTALYQTPAGRIIQNKGIVPDISIGDFIVDAPKTEADTSMLAPIREFDLKSHLANKTAGNAFDDEEESAGLAQSDFQLYQAVKIVKTMIFVDHSHAMK